MKFIFPESISQNIYWRLAECDTHFIYREARGEDVLSEIPSHLQWDPTASEHRLCGFNQ